MSILLKITSRLDITPVIDVLKNADIFTDAKSKEEALAQLTTDKAAELAFSAISAILPQLDTVADFLPALAAAYKGVTLEEANTLDAFTVLDEIIHDEGMISFFRRLLHDKAKPKRVDFSRNIMNGV
jgi:hypothetical protein